MNVPAARPSGPTPPGSVSVIVTVLNDLRVARTLESLLGQQRIPDEVIVDDGGGSGEVQRITEGFTGRDPRVHHLSAPGNIPESRNAALAIAHGEFVAFLDADEVAPPEWLTELLRPFADPAVGFTGGPTPALPESLRTVGARYYDGYLRRFYDVVARAHPHALPMGNSAWRAAVFRQVGQLDTTLYRRAASEDQEVAVRALQAGWKGVYVATAGVGHDFSDISAWRLMRKQRIYAEGGFVVWRRRGATYEASAGRVLPYIALPGLVVAGVLLALPALTRSWGEALIAIGGFGLAALALGLTVWGWRLDRTYPGLRYSALEIPRRWATLLGAFFGLLHYGWSGRRMPPPKLRSPSGKP
ncbi:MAG: glycosyltransferase [Thermoplasmata archaeon]|nr:glycosyltransferase [Thermoplasmata archaeon]